MLVASDTVTKGRVTMKYDGQPQEFALWFFSMGAQDEKVLRTALGSVPEGLVWEMLRHGLRQRMSEEFRAIAALRRFSLTAGTSIGEIDKQAELLERKGYLIAREQEQRTGRFADKAAA